MKIVTVDQMRTIERRASDEHGLTSPLLMERAGLSVAELLRAHLGGDVAGVRVLVLVGPGNNGGDGRVAARLLAQWGAATTLFIWKDRHLETGSPSQAATADQAAVLDAIHHADVVLDALLGTGHARPLDSSLRELLAAVTSERKTRPAMLVAALDLPTGINADTGEVDPGTLHCDLTITLAFPKVGMLLFPGAAYIGEMEIGSIGLPSGLADQITCDLLDADQIRQLLPPRPLDSNKGTFGKVMVLAGSLPFPGSAFLAASAASRVGAGLVTVATTPDLAPIYAVKLSEATFHLLPRADTSPEERARALIEGLRGYSALLVGPGLGQADTTHQMVLAVFAGLRSMPDAQRPQLIVDADGLNILATVERWWELLPPRTVLTPHPGEMSRLRGGARVSGGYADRLEIALHSAAAWQHVVVLKGACTLVADPGGHLAINWPPNPALATAGTGDVLAGTVAGLLAQHVVAESAARAAVYLHARAGLNVSQRIGTAGLVASDLLSEIPIALRDTRDG